MTVESVTYIDDLNASYPAGTDVKSEGDNHIRNIKTALKNTFSAVAGEVTADHAELSLLEGKEGMGLTLKGYQTYTSGSGIYTTPAGVKALYVELIGGGGGGGGAKGNGAGTAAAASGGGGGGYCAKLITSPAATYAYAVGAGGAGGVGSAAASAGGDSTFSGGAVSLSAGGGSAGESVNATASAQVSLSAAGGTASGGDLNIFGSSSTFGGFYSTIGWNFLSSSGAAARGGGSATTNESNANGMAGLPYGGGGGASRADSTSSSAYTGGAGAAGLVRITEYY
jgi:hypothetical protein